MAKQIVLEGEKKALSRNKKCVMMSFVRKSQWLTDCYLYVSDIQQSTVLNLFTFTA